MWTRVVSAATTSWPTCAAPSARAARCATRRWRTCRRYRLNVVDWVEAGLKGKSLVPADQAATITASVPHGHVAAVSAQADALGLPTLLGPSGRQRDLAMALIISRVVQPASKLATASWWDDTTLGVDHDVAGASTDEVYACMDWLVDRQEAIEAKLAERHLAGPANPSRMALFDLSSSWMEGRHCPLAKRGYSRDGKKGTLQIEYGLLTDPAGRPVAIKVFPGNTADPTAFTHAVATVRDKFTLAQLVMVGDRGMITNARIAALRADPDSDLGWLTALRAPAIKQLAAAGGPLQPTPVRPPTSPRSPAPTTPANASSPAATPSSPPNAPANAASWSPPPANFGPDRRRRHRRAGSSAPTGSACESARSSTSSQDGQTPRLDHHDTASDLHPQHRPAIAAEAALDGIYVLRTSVPAATLDAAGVVTAYKSLAKVERDFRSLKSTTLTCARSFTGSRTGSAPMYSSRCLPPTLTWHLRKTLAPLTFTDEHPPTPADPVAPATRSASATRKASTRTTLGRPTGPLLPQPARPPKNQRTPWSQGVRHVTAGVTSLLEPGMPGSKRLSLPDDGRGPRRRRRHQPSSPEMHSGVSGLRSSIASLADENWGSAGDVDTHWCGRARCRCMARGSRVSLDCCYEHAGLCPGRGPSGPTPLGDGRLTGKGGASWRSCSTGSPVWMSGRIR